MNCSTCNAVLAAHSKFCTKCGSAQNAAQPAEKFEEKPSTEGLTENEPAPGLVARIRSSKPTLISLGVVSAILLIVAGAGLGSAGAFDWAFGDKYSKSDVTTAYNRGYSTGESAGYSNGFTEGETSGKSSGYNEGYSAGESSGKSTGYDEGYSAGQTAGYSSGKSDGYDDGYTSGKSDGESTGFSNGCEHVFNEIYSDTGYSAIVAWDSYYRRTRGSIYYTSSSLCD